MWIGPNSPPPQRQGVPARSRYLHRSLPCFVITEEKVQNMICPVQNSISRVNILELLSLTTYVQQKASSHSKEMSWDLQLYFLRLYGVAWWLLVIPYVQRVRPSYTWSGPLYISLKGSGLKYTVSNRCSSKMTPGTYSFSSYQKQFQEYHFEEVPFLSIARILGWTFYSPSEDTSFCKRRNEGKFIIQQALLQVLLYHKLPQS